LGRQQKGIRETDDNMHTAQNKIRAAAQASILYQEHSNRLFCTQSNETAQ